MKTSLNYCSGPGNANRLKDARCRRVVTCEPYTPNGKVSSSGSSSSLLGSCGFTHLTESQITELADYYSKQPAMQAEAETPDARGELIFRHGVPESGIAQCSACHGAEGRGHGQTPRVAGQHAAYMIRQIQVFQQADLRERGDLTSQIAHTLSDADAEAVAHYMARLGP